jgi:hypothetical protein
MLWFRYPACFLNPPVREVSGLRTLELPPRKNGVQRKGGGSVKHRKASVSALVSVVLLGSATLASVAVAASKSTTQDIQRVHRSGTTRIGKPHTLLEEELAAASGKRVIRFAVRSYLKHQKSVDRSLSPASNVGAEAPVATGAPVVAAASVNTSFDGLTHRDQRLANGGNQFSLEPPDQGLCVGNGFVMETVNTVMNVYNTSGSSLLGVTDLNTFYGFPAQFNRTTFEQGPFLADPNCLYDAEVNRWFHTILALEVDPISGEFLGPNDIALAVSETGDPTGEWAIYKIPAQNDGTEGTPNHHCSQGPCIGDFPQLGADANGIYITTNEYSLFGPEFTSAQVYAISKSALAGTPDTIDVVHMDTLGDDAGLPGFTLWPAKSPGTTEFEVSANGTEYFLSSNAAEEVGDETGSSNTVVLWALTNTESLDAGPPVLTMFDTRLTVQQPYGTPPLSDQKPGDFPLGQCINDTTLKSAFWNGRGCWRLFFLPQDQPAHDEVESSLDSSDTRVLTTFFSGGLLYGALGTAVEVGDEIKAGIAWYVIEPTAAFPSGVSGTIEAQGFLAVVNNNVTYPTIAVTAPTTTDEGKGIMAFSLMGEDHYPSAAFATIDVSTEDVVGDVQVIREGLGPHDGFTGYKAFVGDPPRTRWGDYGAAVVDGTNIWVGSEYIGQTCTLAQFLTNTPASPLGSCNMTRTSLGNWFTRVSQITP